MRLARQAGKVGRKPGAFVLVGVLIVVMLLSMVAVSLMFRLKAEDTASAAGVGTELAWEAAMSGVEEAMRVGRQAASGSLDWQDSPGLFQERAVYDDGADQWYFTVYSAGDPDRAESVRYGLTDEAGKLNVNEAGLTNLLMLPRMSPSIAEAILDFIDADDTPRPEGAEQEYYDALPIPYKIRNGPLATVEELLLVRGVTPALLYGEDANLNLVLDANEDDGDQSFPPDNGDGKLDLGWRQYLTVSSYELDNDKDGAPRTNVNDPDDPLPTVSLPAALTNYITLLRTNKMTITHAADLLEAKTRIQDPSGAEVEVESGVGKNELPLVLDLFTATAETRLKGLINVNTASAAVLATVPGIGEPLAEAIVSGRRGLSAEKRRTIAWLYTDDVVPADVFKAIAPHLTARGFQFSFHAVGYGVPSGRYRVLEAVIDCAQDKPVLTYLRDLTRFGMPFRIQTEATDQGAKPLAQAARSRHPRAASERAHPFHEPTEMPPGFGVRQSSGALGMLGGGTAVLVLKGTSDGKAAPIHRGRTPRRWRGGAGSRRFMVPMRVHRIVAALHEPRSAGVSPASLLSVSLGGGPGGETPQELAAEDGCATGFTAPGHGAGAKAVSHPPTEADHV